MDDITATHGVLGSDELIVAVARRLNEALPPDAICGRVASDKFAISMTASDDTEADAVIRIAIDAIARPHWIDTVVRLSAHAGFAQAPRHATTRGELTRRADLALRTAAKRGPGAIVVFDLAINTVSTDQKFIHRELPRAISANDLECTTSRSCRHKADAWLVSRPCCAGTTQRVAQFRRRNSSRLPNKWD